MARCSVCGRPAVYVNRAGGIALCERHFLQYFDRKVRRTLRRYDMLRPGDRIAIAVSGGKDSLSLLHYLHRLSRRAPGWRVFGILVDEGIKGYREYTVQRLERAATELGVEYHIVSFREELGYTLDEIVRIAAERGLPYKPCTFCGVFRRYLLNRAARRLGATVVATGHNLDDVVQTYLMNIMGNDWEKVARLAPVSGPARHPLFVRKVKPFYEVLEKETTLYAILHGFYDGFEECPYARLSPRWEIRRMINRLEEQNPGLKYSLLRSLENAIKIVKAAGLAHEGEEVPYRCAICGEPSAHPVCRACILRIELGIMEVDEEKLRGLPEAARRIILSTLKLRERRSRKPSGPEKPGNPGQHGATASQV